MDKFRIELLAATPHPQQLIWAAMHQDYSEDAVYDQRDKFPDEAKAGELIIKHLLAGNKGHFGPLEHPQITVNVCGFPHSMMQQIRTHRVGITFDVQCLAGATEVTFVNTNGETSKKHKKTIAELHDLWVNGEKAVRERKIRGRNGEEPGTYRRNCRQRIQKMKLRVLNEETGQFEVGHIQDVMCSGLQPVYRLTLANNSTLDCTVNHRILTPNGWQTMADAIQLVTDDRGEVFSIGENCQVLCNGIPVQAGERPYTNKLWLESQVNQGKNAVEIAKLLDCTSATIQTWAKRHGLTIARGKHGRKKGEGVIIKNDDHPVYRNIEWLTEQIEKGLYVDEMAKIANCSVEAIKKWVYRHGLTLNKKSPGSKNPWNKNKGGYKLHLSDEARQQRSEISKKITQRGEDSHFWRGGVSSSRTMIAAWTRQIAPQVHRKFDYTCQSCGKRGGTLHAHHLVPVFANPDLAYDFDNLVTLCKDCHELIHHNHQEDAFAKTFNQQPQIIQNWKPKRKPAGNILKAHPVKVIAAEYLGMQMTYDLEVAGSWHNFVANGVVVHNSFRYTGTRITDILSGKRELEDVFYLRPVGDYTNRQGKKYYYSPEQRQADLDWCLAACQRYGEHIAAGMAEEQARSIIPFDVRQHFVMSCNVRSLMHLLDLRWKKDAQLEAQQFAELLFAQFEQWVPAIAQWYRQTRAQKAKLSP